MRTSAIELIWIFAAYALGCLTAGYYWVRWHTGEDIRDHGSGAVGARNVGRRLGQCGFAVTFIADFLKGALVLTGATSLGLSEETVTAVLFAVIAGHNWPLQLRFRGGKGIAVSVGALLVYHPPTLLILILTFLPLWFWLRNLILAGMVAYAMAPMIVFPCGLGALHAFAMSGVAVLVLLAHRKNLRDELAGIIASRVPAASDKSSRKSTHHEQ